jgi:DNA-binding beta-propeller fold protein YncE
MITPKRLAVGIVAGLSGWAVAGPAYAELIASSLSSGTLYTLNPATGAASSPRSARTADGTALTSLLGLTVRPSDDTVFGLAGGKLYTIKGSTGLATLVGATGFSLIEGDIAYDPVGGFIYGLQVYEGGTYQFIRIDPSTGAGAAVANLANVSDVSAAAFGPGNTLYVIDLPASGNSKLLTLNKQTGALTNPVTLTARLGPTSGLAFDPATGTAYVADGNGSMNGTSNLYTLNLTTGQLTRVSTSGTGISGGVSGLVFAPEPAALATVATAAALLLRRRRS